jgi:hypothetical protein
VSESTAGGLYQFVELQQSDPGEERFYPRKGDHTRSMTIRTTSAAWYGAKFTSTDPGTMATRTYFVPPPTPEAVAELLAAMRRPRRTVAPEGD